MGSDGWAERRRTVQAFLRSLGIDPAQVRALHIREGHVTVEIVQGEGTVEVYVPQGKVG